MDRKLKRRIEQFAMNGVPGHLLRRAQQRAVEFYFQEVGENGPTPQQYSVLLNVFQNPGMTQTALVQASAIDRSTLTEILRRMVARGLITRTRTKTDQRANALSLTPEGEAVLASSFAAAERAQQRILDPVPEEHREQAMEILGLLAGYADEQDSPDKSG